MRKILLGLTSVFLLVGCNLTQQLSQTTDAIQSNRYAVEMSTQSISDIDQAVTQATSSIDVNAQAIQRVNSAIQENERMVTTSSRAIQDNYEAVQKSTEVINQNVQALESMPSSNILIPIALLFLSPWLGLILTNLRLKQILKVLKKK